MYLTEADKPALNAELEALTFTPGICVACGKAAHVYHDPETGASVCLDCLEAAVDEAVAVVNARQWFRLHTQNACEY